MPVPLCQAKAEFFRMLGHPVRMRVLELLQGGPLPVRDLLTAIEVEPSALSQQLAVLRRSGTVPATREGSTVVYELAGGDVADLMRAARRGVVASALALKAVVGQARMDQVDFAADLPGEHGEEEHSLLAEHIVAYRIDGPVFFAGAHRFLLELSEVADVRVVILRMSRITTMDATGALVLKDALDKLNRRGIAVMTSGIRPAQRQALESVGALDLLQREGREYATTPEAIAGARAHLHQAGFLPAATVTALVTEEASR